MIRPLLQREVYPIRRDEPEACFGKNRLQRCSNAPLAVIHQGFWLNYCSPSRALSLSSLG